MTTLAGIRAKVGYKRRPGSYGGKPSLAVDNTLDRQFDLAAPDQAWVKDITYIRTLEGFAYLAVVIDLHSRRVVGWSMQSRQTTDVVLQALHMAVGRRKPKSRVVIHSDQGSQFTSLDWAAFIRAHNLEPSMSRRGNCHDNAVAESSSPRSSVSSSGAAPTKPAKKHGRTCSITSRCSTTRCASRSGTGCCRPSGSNDSRLRRRKASRKLGATQFTIAPAPASIMCGIIAMQPRKVPSRLTEHTRQQSA